MKKHWALYALYLLVAVVAIVAIMKHEPISTKALVLSLVGGLIWGVILGHKGDLWGGLYGGLSLGAAPFIGTLIDAWELNIWIGAILALASYATFWPIYLAVWFQKPLPAKNVD